MAAAFNGNTAAVALLLQQRVDTQTLNTCVQAQSFSFVQLHFLECAISPTHELILAAGTVTMRSLLL
jgi:hypothetical protein